MQEHIDLRVFSVSSIDDTEAALRSCKFQDKGCAFYHPPSSQDLPHRSTTPSSIPSSSSLTSAVNAPVFVPKSAVARAASPSLSAFSPSFVPSNQSQGLLQGQNGGDYPMLDNHNGHQQEYSNGSSYDEYDTGYPAEQHYPLSNSGYLSVSEPLNFHLYTSSIPSSTAPPTHFLPAPPEHRQNLQLRAHTARLVPVNLPTLGLPDDVGGYHSLVPLDTHMAERDRRKIGNWHTSVFRAVQSSDGTVTCLRRIENFRLPSQHFLSPIDAFSKLPPHPAIVPIKEAFTTRAFGDNSLIVAYEFQTGARTLGDFISSKQSQRNRGSDRLDDSTIWSFIIQIASAIKNVHDNGLAVRLLDTTKILVVGQNRVKLSSLCLLDILLYQGPDHQTLMLHQQEDLYAFARVIVALCGNGIGNEIRGIVGYLSGKGVKTIDTVLTSLNSHILSDLDSALLSTDRLENELMGELENARLVRLLCKFGFINERPEFALDPRWSETGDRYIIRLFRDYVFHQIDESGNPVTNMSHVLSCLNKLDAGSSEKLMLISRDEQNCLVVSYADIKACIDGAFKELTANAS